MGLIGVIPAAGKATRMGELGASLPKALIEVDGRTLLERSIETLQSIGVSRIVVVVGHLAEKILERDLSVAIAHQERPGPARSCTDQARSSRFQPGRETCRSQSER